MHFENLLLEKQDRIATLYINRPEALNALNSKTLIELDDAVQQIAEDDSIDLLIITGSGNRAFVAGADIAFMQDLTAMEGREFGALGQKVFMAIEKMDKPVIAAVNGFALGGGCELAMCCDFRIASSKAKFGQPEVGLGITPGFGGTQRLPRLVGMGMAKQLLLTADVIKTELREVWLPKFLLENGMVKSASEGKRMLEQDGVKINGQKHTSQDVMLIDGMVIQVGKRKFIKIHGN